jgi:hypothetical protein
VHRLRGVQQRCSDILILELGIFPEDVLSREPLGEASDNQAYRDTGPPYTRLPSSQVRVGKDPFHKVIFHLWLPKIRSEF